jgi:hypothetical protein
MKKSILAFLPFLLHEFNHKDFNNIYRGDNKRIDTLVAEQYDGPYVHYQEDQVIVKYIIPNNGTKIIKTDSVTLLQKGSLSLKVMTDVADETFSVRLKKELQNESSEFSNVSKLLVLSDIEGNFSAFRKLLQANNVIDGKLNWKFGNGHLVLIGDFFDRGNQVTEVLWLIYFLEEKAKANGGYVHFILGNHEIMNLSGDLRFLEQKYKDNSILLNKKYVSLYDENSELGRWLRTKNIVEKIGDNLFVHGGISGEMNKLNMSIPNINQLSRPYYADSTFNYTDKKLDTIFGDLGPFWYRGYYNTVNKATPQQIDSTLSQFTVKHIVTGHSIVADTVSVWYNGKIFNTDTHHAADKSEALFIQKDKYYRVNAKGEKVLLFER